MRYHRYEKNCFQISHNINPIKKKCFLWWWWITLINYIYKQNITFSSYSRKCLPESMVKKFSGCYKWDKVFKSGPSKICGRQLLKCLKDLVCLSRPYPFKFFKGCLPKCLLGPFLNIFSQISIEVSKSYMKYLVAMRL